jgi:serine phosphatase RsbU (regulator of sigma subunit)
VWRARTGRVEVVRTDGTWLAVITEIERYTNNAMIQLEDDDVVVLYTDGITEAMNHEGRMFDFDRLVATVEASPSRTPADVVRCINDAVAAWIHVQLDDQSLLVFRYQAGAGARHRG